MLFSASKPDWLDEQHPLHCGTDRPTLRFHAHTRMILCLAPRPPLDPKMGEASETGLRFVPFGPGGPAVARGGQ